jgi:hypothetical protein
MLMGVEVRINVFLTSAMEVYGQLLASAALPPRIGKPVPIHIFVGSEAGLAGRFFFPLLGVEL